MSNRSNKFQFQVQEDIFDGKSMLDENNFYNQRFGRPDQLTNTLTWILGDNKRNFPLAMQTHGNMMGKGTTKGVKDFQFEYPVMSRLDKAVVVAESSYTSSDRPGLGHSQFKLVFTDNWVKRNYIIESPRGVQAYVIGDGVKVGTGYEYTLQLASVTAKEFCPIEELQAGTLWADLHTANAQSESRGTEHKTVAPGKYKNQLSMIRMSHSWAGNSANRMMNIEIKTDGKSTRVWMDFAMWQFEQRWLNECEHLYWYSRYNRDADGTIKLLDPQTGKPIPRGSGVLEQIPNYSTYTRLSYEGLQNKIADAFFGQSDTENMTVTLYTGRGGIREFDRAMKDYVGAAKIVNYNDVQEKFIVGSGRNLGITGFYDHFYHIDGYLIKVKHNPIFDYGKRALKSPLHPETGFPLESYRMVFLDDSNYDGQPNIQYVYEEGREFQHGVVAGLTPMPKSLNIMGGFNLEGNTLALLSSDQDKSSYHRLKTGGIQILRANKCLHLECIAGL